MTVLERGRHRGAAILPEQGILRHLRKTRIVSGEGGSPATSILSSSERAAQPEHDDSACSRAKGMRLVA